MSKNIYILCILSIILVGCAGLGNQSFILDDGYSVMHISAHDAKLIYDETGENLSGSTVVPEKVVRVNETDRYIIAEQELLDRDGNPKKEYRYWIEDKDNREIVGRNMDYSEFEDKLVELSIEDLELLDVDSFPSMN